MTDEDTMDLVAAQLAAAVLGRCATPKSALRQAVPIFLTIRKQLEEGEDAPIGAIDD